MSGAAHPFRDERNDPRDDDEAPEEKTYCWMCGSEEDEFGVCWDLDCDRFNGGDWDDDET